MEKGKNQSFELLLVEDLKKHFPVRRGFFRKAIGYIYAVDGVGFSIRRGETLGLVGESGCGKSTVGRCLVKLYHPTAGRIMFEGKDICKCSKSELVHLRRNMQMIFQDPYSSLNPRLRVQDIIGEALRVHGLVSKGEWKDRVHELLAKVGLEADHMARYPHEFSGGQRQRIGIARALALSPKFIIADEPVSALDVSVQAQVINLLDSLKEDFGLSYLVIAHDLAVVEHIADRVAVMYLGKLVELAEDHALYGNPKHPYSQALLTAVPKAERGARQKRRQNRRFLLQSEVPSPMNPPLGCHFHTRCPRLMDHCRNEEPPFIEVEQNHWVACFLHA